MNWSRSSGLNAAAGFSPPSAEPLLQLLPPLAAFTGLAIPFGFFVRWIARGDPREARRNRELRMGEESLLPPPPRSKIMIVECEFAFQTMEGRPILTVVPAVFNADLGAEEYEPILYDPADPHRALIISGLRVEMDRI
jgi:hypothetical protein